MSAGAPGPAAWVLNLDAEVELATAGDYTPSAATRARVRDAARRVVGLVAPGDVILEDTAAPTPLATFAGRAWCPTPRALRLMREAGVVVPQAPGADVLRRVNDRRFAIELAPGPLASRYVTDIDALHAALQPNRTYVLKRGLSFAGRGHRRVELPLQPDDLRWCDGALQRGAGVAVEPWVQRTHDFVQHGWVRRDGGFELGRALWQICDARGVWEQTAPMERQPGALDDGERRDLRSAAELAASALAGAGYFGPFGIDAFRYRSDGAARFNPMVEINARYGMGWGLSLCPQPAH